VFIILFSGALNALAGGGEEDDRIPLPVANLDAGSASQSLLEGLDAAGGVRVELHDSVEAQAELEDGDLHRLLTIPADFTAGLSQGRQVTLRLVSSPKADMKETEVVRLVVDGVAQDLALESQILASLEQMGDMQANAPEEFQVFTAERSMAQARSQFESSRDRPLVSVVERVPQLPEGGSEETPEAVQLAVPGFTVLFVFLRSQTAARSIYDEKKVGSFRRLLAAPISRAALLAGKLVPSFVISLLQTVVMFMFGMVGMRLFGLAPLSLGDSPGAVLLAVILVALCSSALGILIAGLARTENQIGGLSSVILWAMGILGGSFIPLMVLERYLGPVTRIVPHYWANNAFNDLLVRGLGIGDVALEFVVLLGFSLLFFLIGVWRFDFD
jgi:ABC-2 type transport system permease protein